jgi:topoisomerase-4 subunit A
MNNAKLYVNRAEGFIGTSLKRDEFVSDCSDIDDVIIFRKDGKMIVTKVDSKIFVGKDIIHVAVFKKKDKRTVYNFMYRDGSKGPSYMKRFNVISVTRDKEYDLANGNRGSLVHYFTANLNGEAEVVTINLRAAGGIKKLKWDIDFTDLAVKGRAVRGNIITKHTIKSIDFKSEGVSTLKPRKIWFDDAVQRLNVDDRGELLGEFRAEDKLLIITQSGKVKAVKPDLAMHFDKDMIVLEKWKPKKPISAIYFDGEKERYYVKRFLIEATEKEEFFITEHPKAQLEIVATDYRPVAEVIFSKRSLEKQKVNFEDFIAIKGIKAQGNQLTTEKIKLVNLLEALPFEEPEEERFEEIEVVDEEVIAEQLPAEGAEKENKKIILEAVSPDDKAAIALKKSIAQKKAEEQKRDDESQTKLF